jgi:hypothetical protein
MWYSHLELMNDRLRRSPAPHDKPRRTARRTVEAVREHHPIAIRRAHDGDVPLLYDLAEVDSAKPLDGPVLVAVVDGRIWAALALEDERVIADPFLPTAPAVELLRLRGAQLRAADGRPQRGRLPRWVPGRARA